MKVRLVKPEQHAGEKESKKRPSDSDLTLTVQSWVKEFKSRKFDRRILTTQQTQGTTRT